MKNSNRNHRGKLHKQNARGDRENLENSRDNRRNELRDKEKLNKNIMA